MFDFSVSSICSDGSKLSPEQIENIIEFLPSKEERKGLEAYMLEGGQDAAEKFDGLCECEKFMVSMMTVKHAKRKVRALLFRLQFLGCLQSIAEGEFARVLAMFLLCLCLFFCEACSN